MSGVDVRLRRPRAGRRGEEDKTYHWAAERWHGVPGAEGRLGCSDSSRVRGRESNSKSNINIHSKSNSGGTAQMSKRICSVWRNSSWSTVHQQVLLPVSGLVL